MPEIHSTIVTKVKNQQSKKFSKMSKTNQCTHSTRCICGLCQKGDDEMTHATEQDCEIIDLVSDSSEDDDGDVTEDEELSKIEACHTCQDDFATMKNSKCRCFFRAAYCDFCFLTAHSNNFCTRCKQAIEPLQMKKA